MTTKRQAEICVERNLSDDEIVEMTGCHPECVEFVRAWGRGERVEVQDFMSPVRWHALEDYSVTGDYNFTRAERYRVAPRRIHVKATLSDGTEREAEFPEPVRDLPRLGSKCFVSHGNFRPGQPRWQNNPTDRELLRQGRVFRTYEQALERDKAMIWISGGEVE